jgi:hypothetical protein
LFVTEGIVDLLGQGPADAFDTGQLLHLGAGHFLQAAELLEQLLAAFRTDAGYPFQGRTGAGLRTPGPVTGDGKTVRLVPDLLDQVQGR